MRDPTMTTTATEKTAEDYVDAWRLLESKGANGDAVLEGLFALAFAQSELAGAEKMRKACCRMLRDDDDPDELLTGRTWADLIEQHIGTATVVKGK